MYNSEMGGDSLLVPAVAAALQEPPTRGPQQVGAQHGEYPSNITACLYGQADEITALLKCLLRGLPKPQRTCVDLSRPSQPLTCAPC
jgi:hypothetical protein